MSPAVSETSLSQSTHQHAGTRQLNVELVAPEKLAFNTKKRYEYEVRTKLSSLPFLAHVSSKARICAIAVLLPLSSALNIDVDSFLKLKFYCCSVCNLWDILQMMIL